VEGSDTKRCPWCREEKPRTSFYVDRKARDGRSHTCVACRRTYSKENLSRTRNLHLNRRYGISSNEYDKMVRNVGGKCEICGIIPSRLHIDHNHRTGAIRGLLCRPCNHALGGFQDSEEILRFAIMYLSRTDSAVMKIRQEGDLFL